VCSKYLCHRHFNHHKMRSGLKRREENQLDATECFIAVASNWFCFSTLNLRCTDKHTSKSGLKSSFPMTPASSSRPRGNSILLEKHGARIHFSRYKSDDSLSSTPIFQFPLRHTIVIPVYIRSYIFQPS
jgi:hypothetical protein